MTIGLTAADPDHLAGIHLNFVMTGPGGDLSELTDEEQDALTAMAEFLEWGSGYSALQSTRPQTLGYALADSPVGQCAWIAEKFHAWTDHDGDPYTALSRDQMLDDISLYWLTATAASSARLYWESGLSRPSRASGLAGGLDVRVPAGISVFPREIIRLSRRWVEPSFSDLRFYERADRGGHFAAYEQPAVFADQVRRAFRTMR